jgi:MFS transporter, MHS family, proline/betaine transporter
MVTQDPAINLTDSATPERTHQNRVKAVGSAVLGNVMEWYDFAIYAFFATIIAEKFFPSEDPNVSILAAFAAFGSGFVARPIGSIVIGRIADTKGRKVALIITIYLMAFSTVGIGLLPSYDTIGVLAPIMLVVCRLAQGLAAGGEFGGATAFIVEWAPEKRRGFYGSFVMASLSAGMLLGSGVAAISASMMSEETLLSWGWRVPFVLGVMVLAVGVFMRRKIHETPAYEKAKTESPQSREKAPHPAVAALRAFGLAVAWTGSFYVVVSYMPTFTQKVLNLSRAEALWANSAGLLALVIAIPAAGLLSDIFGRRRVLLAACAAFIVLMYPILSLMIANPTFSTVLLCQILLGLIASLYNGPAPAAMAEMFSTRSRTLWMSLGYAVSNAIFGGFAPFFVTLLISATGSPQSPSIYVIPLAIISSLFIFKMRETAHEKLN